MLGAPTDFHITSTSIIATPLPARIYVDCGSETNYPLNDLSYITTLDDFTRKCVGADRLVISLATTRLSSDYSCKLDVPDDNVSR